ncbi:hypothetical protein DICPUDRAFT_76312 [Dictyostelium purpureum]|uniref:Uncharacterized protein n=1 Tax=Dictyostelium purpureum TaxID=5786 RepID=F0ZD84_DICPU|nr:uncharacterized protein DICPUDRAFT_76312 [Dictyostelium purpureum]EGC38064.1 hypothetical protein DICPUDRAFT_76312 [Dictyostelium purpureum]|eukprot:XP_003285371.1 hypothetical protein DICPUDRAFT_76312 [Dictyostelium purpureum]
MISCPTTVDYSKNHNDKDCLNEVTKIIDTHEEVPSNVEFIIYNGDSFTEIKNEKKSRTTGIKLKIFLKKFKVKKIYHQYHLSDFGMEQLFDIDTLLESINLSGNVFNDPGDLSGLKKMNPKLQQLSISIPFRDVIRAILHSLLVL